MSAWKCGDCGAMNEEDLIRCRLCFGTLVESDDVLPWPDASSPAGVPSRMGPEMDPETDPTCLGTKAYLDGIVSGLGLSERRDYLDWLAFEVQVRLAQNEYAMVAMGDDE